MYVYDFTLLIMLRERSNITYCFGWRELLKPSEWPNRHITFSGRKSLIHSFSCSFFGICGGGDWKCHMGEAKRGLAENVKIPSYGGRGYKIAQKMHMIFERSLRLNNQVL